ncbi:MAG TPA: outer membrane protein assembly factor BamE [Rhizomicrobium sp.]|jgi:outer membrane protein assembly factor BamE (lipoprotein component of BamABCDE complex)|nr:outer membrane protein assembly factor BamE [Rhizomicrobium sp.]HEX4534000.1 outer membrane protein assembly factor BamE [Rhizomicrobium sp.]
MRFVALALSSALLLGCTPIVDTRGFLPDPAAEASIKVGGDTKTTLQTKLGDPSTQSTFGGDTWYYISSTQKTIAFFKPRVLTRSILAVEFNRDGQVDGLHHYGLKDGHLVAFETRETAARGHEITFLEQLFNATPGVPLTSAQTPTPGAGGNGPLP